MHQIMSPALVRRISILNISQFRMNAPYAIKVTSFLIKPT